MSDRRRALTIVVAFGIVSLLGDIVYEGARSILGPFFLTLGASAAVVGFASGAGEFVGYGLRLASGVIADRTRAYWPLTIAGYTLTVVAVPLLGWVGRVDLAVALVVAERLGKAIRSPARDTLLSAAARPLGSGFAFGLHEALDQTGAVAGPLLLAAVLTVKTGDYRFAFTLLAVPAVLVLLTLVVAYRRMPTLPSDRDPHHTEDGAALSATIRRYLWFVGVAAVGFAPFPVIAFHLDGTGTLTDAAVPTLFAVAMAVDAGVALLAGRVYDRTGLVALYGVPLFSALALLAFTTSQPLVWMGGIAWGAALGIQESTLRAAVGDLAASTRKGTVYGIFNTVYGVALLVGGSLIGLLYGARPGLLVSFILVAQVGAAALLFPLLHR